MKLKIVCIAALVLSVFATTIDPAGALASHPAKRDAQVVANAQATGAITDYLIEVAKAKAMGAAKLLVEKAFGSAFNAAGNYLLKLAGFDLGGHDVLYQRLDELKAQIEEVKVQIAEVQDSVTRLSANVLDTNAQRRFDAVRIQFNYIQAGWDSKYLPLIDSNKKYFEALTAAGGNVNDPSLDGPRQALATDRFNFYQYFNLPDTLAAWRVIHGFLVSVPNSPSIIASKGAVIAQKKRYLTTADSLELRELYYGLQTMEAVAFTMAAEAQVPCQNDQDCAALVGSGAPSRNNHTGLNATIVAYNNAAVREARQLPPLIPVGVVIDNVGGGSTNGKQQWLPQRAGARDIVRHGLDLDNELQGLLNGTVNLVGFDGAMAAEYQLPSRQQLTTLLTVSQSTSEGNRGFVPNTAQSVNAWLSTLDTGPRWQAIATRNSPAVMASDKDTFTVRCFARRNNSGGFIDPSVDPANGRARENRTTLRSNGNQIAFDTARPIDSGAGSGVFLPSIAPQFANSVVPGIVGQAQCENAVRQRAAAQGTGQLLATRPVGTMRQDYLGLVSEGQNIQEGADLSYQNLASLNLGVNLDNSGQPIRNDRPLRNTDLTGANLEDAILTSANLSGTKLAHAILTGVTSGDIQGTPASLPDGWILRNGYLVGPGANLTNAKLAGASLSGLDLRGANFAGADLTDTDLRNAKLTGVRSGGIVGEPILPAGWFVANGHLVGPGANLSGANLRDVDLVGIDLSDVRSGGTECTGCKLPVGWRWTGLASGYLVGPRADLTDANLSGLDLRDADLARAQLTNIHSEGTDCTGCALPAGWRWTGLPSGYLVGPGADLGSADFTGVDLTGADFTGADLTSADFPFADLTNATLTGARASGIDLRDATLTGVRSGGIVAIPTAPFLPAGWRLENGFLLGPGVNLANADLSKTNLAGANLTNANLTGATVTGVRSGGVNCTGCQLPTDWTWTGSPSGFLVGPGADLAGANLTGVDLRTARLARVTSGGIVGTPQLPTGWMANRGYLVGPGADLKNANFTGANLSGATLTGVTSGGIIGSPGMPSGWRLVNGYLVGRGADLTGAFLPGVVLEGFNLEGANLTNVSFESASLPAVVLTNATLDGADFQRARLGCGRSTTQFVDKWGSSNLSGASVNGTNFTDTDLGCVTSVGTFGNPILPRGWRIVNSNLVGPSAQLVNANLAGADLRGVNLAGIMLTNADLTNANLIGANFSNHSPLYTWNGREEEPRTATLAGTKLAGVTSGGIITASTPPPLPAGWRLVNGYLIGPGAVGAGVNLTGANFTGVDLTGVNLSNANLTNVNFANANLERATITGATITGATFTTDNDNKLSFITSGGLVGAPRAMPASGRYRITEGYFVGPSSNLSRSFFSSDANLGISLSSANFSQAILDNVNLTGAFLNNANLTGTFLRGANLSGANLSNATLTGVVSGGVVGNPVLPPGWRLLGGFLVGPGASLFNTNLDGVDLRAANLAGVTTGMIRGTPLLPTGWKLVNGYLVGPGAELTGADLRNADLTNADLTNATLSRSSLRGATVTGATFTTDDESKLSLILSGEIVGQPAAMPASGRFRITEGFFVGPNSVMSGARFTPDAQLGTALSAVFLNDADLTGVNLTGASLTNADLSRARLTGTNLTGADLSNATLAGVFSGGVTGNPTLPPGWKLVQGNLVGPGANLTDANLRFADLSHADLRMARLLAADLTGADLSFATLTGADLSLAHLFGVTWWNTTCPNGVVQNSSCASPAQGAGPSATVTVKAATGGQNLLVQVFPSLGADAWTFTVDRLTSTGTWTPVGTYNTQGKAEERKLKLPKGTYRVVVQPYAGYSGVTSDPVTL